MPASAYISDAVFDEEIEKIFRRQWLCVGRVDQVPSLGSFFSIDLLGDKLVIVHGKDGQTRLKTRI